MTQTAAHIPFATLPSERTDRSRPDSTIQRCNDSTPRQPNSTIQPRTSDLGPLTPSVVTDLSAPSEIVNRKSYIVNPTQDPSWNERLKAFPSATAFHTREWSQVLSEAYGYEPCYLVVTDPASSSNRATINDQPSTGRAVRAIVPLFSVSSCLTGRRGISLPFTDFCAPLLQVQASEDPCPSASSVVTDSSAAPDSTIQPCNDLTRRQPDPSTINDQPSTAAALLAAALALGRERNWKYLELRGADALLSLTPPTSENPCPSVVKGPTSSVPRSDAPQFVSHELDLRPGEAALWKGLDSGCQRAIRKARAAGVTVRKSDFTSPRSTRDLRAFYDLQCRTRRKHGLPPQPYRFFELIQRHMLESGLGSLYLAEANDKVADCNVADCKVVVAGALYLHFGKSAIFKYGASDERHLDLRPNNLVMWQAIADYAAAGFRTLNFGRTEVYNSGLKRYKLAFGTQEKPLNYARFDYAMNSFVQDSGSGPGTLMRLAQSVFRHMPASVARAAGAFLYPHVA